MVGNKDALGLWIQTGEANLHQPVAESIQNADDV